MFKSSVNRPMSINPLMTLCVAASILEEREASASQKPSPAVEEKHGKSNGLDFVRKFKENYEVKVKLAANTDFRSHTTKIPNHLVAEYIENTSDELRKRFSYKCTYSPNTCSEVVESYGSEVKAFSEMKQHIYNYHILGETFADFMKRKQVTSSIDKMLRPLDETSRIMSKYSKRICSAKTVETVSERVSNRGKSVLAEPTDKDESVQAPLSTYFRDDNDGTDFNDTADTLMFGQFEHDYAKNIDELSTTRPPVHEAGLNKNQRGKFDVAYDKWVLSHLSRHINGDSYLTPPVVPTAPFPFVHDPAPPEPVLVVELHSNGNPVDLVEPTFFKSSTSRISSKKAVENKASKKKTKFSRMVNAPRSVLECVENRVTCKSDVLSDQRDALVPNNSIENSENVEKSIHEIAWKNIRILSQQRRKRKYRDKPSVYICEICNKHFTANTSLTYHYLGHLKIKPFKCHICCRTFTRRHSLKYHMMIHANKNRFQCSTCKRLFRHPSHYKEHLRKHTGEEPYPCKFCSNKFKTRNSFKRHLKMQHQKILTSNGIVPIHNDS
ncbi:unnamed protein product [Larinioides sclopetarius]|uniref:C2H2-type domain-containing protein n=1 Tax=Larinioides sclopetarius TaxID=280406 RepID=A0AAV1ZDY3_9ARAC